MDDHQIDDLMQRMKVLLEKQDHISQEIRELQIAVHSLNDPKNKSIQKVVVSKENVVSKPSKKVGKQTIKPDLERFIGENLISKLGILITVVGVGIGTKYAIDNDMVNPLTRLILGYLVAVILGGLSFLLKNKYNAYSAVLLGGSLAIMYFLTFAGYYYYELFDKGPVFGFMVVLTAGAVYASMKYDQQIIAHMGLVSAYAVPFLLSDGSGQVLYLFIYMAIINTGILAISLKKYWQSLHYSAMIFTWLIYLAWYLDRYSSQEYATAIVFLSIFFILFYFTFLASKVRYQKALVKGDIFLILSNSLIFYTLGFALISKEYNNQVALGIFTLANAVVHFGVAWTVRKIDDHTNPLYRLIIGLAIVYITLSIPVYLDGTWITILWIGEAVALVWVGRTQKALAYERMSYGLICLAFISLMIDWINRLDASMINPFVNNYFLVSLLFIGGMAFINWEILRHPLKETKKWINTFTSYFIPSILIIASYTSVILEIDGYWRLQSNVNSTQLSYVWKMIYSIDFLAAMALLNRLFIKNDTLAKVNLLLIILVLLNLPQITYTFNELTTVNLNNLAVRYLLFMSLVMLWYSVFRYFNDYPFSKSVHHAFELVSYGCVIWILSVELTHWLSIYDVRSSNKLALSILWGISALTLVVIGIGGDKKHLRVAAFSLIGLTLLKLFFYDISHLNTLSKTVVFLMLGMLMLIVSFLYNRFTKKQES